MKSSQELRERLEEVVLSNERLLDLAENEGRDFTDVEQKNFDTNVTERKVLDTKIAQAESREEAREAAKKYRKPVPKITPEEKIQREASLFTAVDRLSRGLSLEGPEAELHQEGMREATRAKVTPSGNLVLPSFMNERTTLTAGTDATAGYLVDNVLQKNIIPNLRPQLKMEELGATVLTGLTSDLTFPRQTADVTMTWEGEVDASAETNTAYDTISLSPNRLGGYVPLSRQLLLQDSVGVEANVRNSIAFAIAKAVDTEAINGTVTSGGILTATNLGSVALGAGGGNPTYNMLVDLETAVAEDNADYGRMAYITTPGVRGYMKQNAKVTSTDSMMAWDANGSLLNGYKAFVSTQLPSTGSKGGTSNLHSMLFGNFQDLWIASFGPGADILVDPYTGAGNAIIKMHVFSWWDFEVIHGESFAVCADITI